MKTNDPLVHIATAPNEPLAALWSAVLEDEGIHSMVRPLSSLATPYIITPYMPHEIYVLTSRAEDARQILASLREENSEVDQGGEP